MWRGGKNDDGVLGQRVSFSSTGNVLSELRLYSFVWLTVACIRNSMEDGCIIRLCWNREGGLVFSKVESLFNYFGMDNYLIDP